MNERTFSLLALPSPITIGDVACSHINARTNGELPNESPGYVFQFATLSPALNLQDGEPDQPPRVDLIGPERWVPDATPDISNAAAVIHDYYTNSPAPTYTPAQYEQALQSWLDCLAKALGYDSIMSACTYANDLTTPKFQAEGQAFLRLRSRVWARCYALLANPPTPIPSPAELIAQFETEFATDIPRP